MLNFKMKNSEHLVLIEGGKPWHAMSYLKTFSNRIFWKQPV